MSNIGSDIFQNKVEKPRELINARIAAVINNSFSAGYPMLASGEAQIKVATMDLSNLSFRLVDGNFRPLKLLNPMYINLLVMPSDANPVGDISSFQGKLPKDRPTPREARKQQEEQLALQMQQLQISATEKQKTDQLMKILTPAQQLQYLALSPEKQEYFRLYNERQHVQTEEEALEEQQLAQQLAQRAEADMYWWQKIGDKQKVAQKIARIVTPQIAEYKRQKELKRQQAVEQAVRSEVQADKETQLAQSQPIIDAVQTSNEQKAFDAQKATAMGQVLITAEDNNP
jgi:hypothetical protein